MQIGMVGLGRMGANIVRRLSAHFHTSYVFDQNPKALGQINLKNVTPVNSLNELVQRLPPPRIVWLMIPSEAVEETVTQLSKHLAQEDILIDGGNSFYKDSHRRAQTLGDLGIHYIDVGTSGGVRALESGFCLTVGGRQQTVCYLEPIFAALAQDKGYLHCGPSGAGHFVKMVHNGIEYAIMQAYAEGFNLLESTQKDSTPTQYRYPIDLAKVANVWRHGSVIRSWLLDLVAESLEKDGALTAFSSNVQDSGEGRWTVMTAIERAVPLQAITAALYSRFQSRTPHSFANKLLAALRFQFGGHTEQEKI